MLKTCKICGEQKAATSFSKNRSKPDGLHYNCKPCDSEKARKWELLNPERAAKKKKDWRAKNIEHAKRRDAENYQANKKAKLAWQKTYYEENKTKINTNRWSRISQNTEKRVAYMRDWRAKNRWRTREYFADRKAAKIKGARMWLAPDSRDHVLGWYMLAKLLSEETGIKHVVDHIVPLKGRAVCGLHVPWNMQVITSSENNKKSNKLLPEFAG